jgi:hypothetical protein
MLKTELIREERALEEHRMEINGKTFELIIKKEHGTAVFEFRDSQVSLDSHEQMLLMDELQGMQVDFLARRAFGTFVPKNSFKKVKKSFKKVF